MKQENVEKGITGLFHSEGKVGRKTIQIFHQSQTGEERGKDVEE